MNPNATYPGQETNQIIIGYMEKPAEVVYREPIVDI
jgi:hypothetical protein